jgi:hypothetical protein
MFRLTNVFVATVTSIRRVALAARYNMYHSTIHMWEPTTHA